MASLTLPIFQASIRTKSEAAIQLLLSPKETPTLLVFHMTVSTTMPFAVVTITITTATATNWNLIAGRHSLNSPLGYMSHCLNSWYPP